jgi:hypothetical protein
MSYIDRRLVLLLLLVITGFVQILQITELNTSASTFSVKRAHDKSTNDSAYSVDI